MKHEQAHPGGISSAELVADAERRMAEAKVRWELAYWRGSPWIQVERAEQDIADAKRDIEAARSATDPKLRREPGQKGQP